MSVAVNFLYLCATQMQVLQVTGTAGAASPAGLCMHACQRVYVCMF